MKKKIRKHRLVEPEYNEFEIIEAIYKGRIREGKVKILCEHCNSDVLVLINGVEPYSVDHLQCPTCDSTYNL
jgi:Zn finger protein HypA/HybF involved in hydrogenase expression